MREEEGVVVFGQAEAVGCELGMILIANSLLQLPVLTGFWG